MRKIFVIPDIHGRWDLLEILMNELSTEIDFSIDHLIFLGDMIDRGPWSKKVLEFILKLSRNYPNVIALYGNHEDLMLKALVQGQYDDRHLWAINGGDSTLSSFDGQVPDGILRWVASLPLSYELPGFFFSHAPVPRENRRNVLLRGKPYTKQELTWTYSPDESGHAANFKDKVGVCGHVHALQKNVWTPRFYPHYIFADAGCGCHSKANLVAIEVQTREVITACAETLKIIREPKAEE